MNEDKLKQVLIQVYGTRIEEEIDTIISRISMVMAAKLYAGSLGDNPLCRLNKFFEDELRKND